MSSQESAGGTKRKIWSMDPPPPPKRLSISSNTHNFTVRVNGMTVEEATRATYTEAEKLGMFPNFQLFSGQLAFKVAFKDFMGKADQRTLDVQASYGVADDMTKLSDCSSTTDHPLPLVHNAAGPLPAPKRENSTSSSSAGSQPSSSGHQAIGVSKTAESDKADDIEFSGTPISDSDVGNSGMDKDLEPKQAPTPGPGPSDVVDPRLVALLTGSQKAVLKGKYLIDGQETERLKQQAAKTKDGKHAGGGQGFLIVVRDKEDRSRLFAMKLPRNQSVNGGVEREIRLWETLAEHPHIASLVDVGLERFLKGPEYHTLLTPLAERGNLSIHIKNRFEDSCPAGKIDEMPAFCKEDLLEPLCFTLQLAYGLEFLHHNGVIHSDLKPVNVLVYNDKSRPFDVLLKICDLGLTVSADRDQTWKEVVKKEGADEHALRDELKSLRGELVGRRVGSGTRGYRPPELAEVLDYVSERSDIWGLMVCLLYAINCGLPEELLVPNPATDKEGAMAAPRRHRQAVVDLFGKGGHLEAVRGVAGRDSEAICDLIADGLHASEGCPWKERPKLASCIEVLQRVYGNLSEESYYKLDHPSKSSTPSELTKAWRSWKMAQAYGQNIQEAARLWTAFDDLSKATPNAQAGPFQSPVEGESSSQPPDGKVEPPPYRPIKREGQFASRLPQGASSSNAQ